MHEECRPSLTGWDLSGMMAAIDLHHEPVCRTTEIYDIWADGVLATKLDVMDLPVAQLPPEYPLAVGLPPSEPSGESTAPGPLTLTLSPKCGERGLFCCPLLPLRGEGSFTPLTHRFYPYELRKCLIYYLTYCYRTNPHLTWSSPATRKS